MFKTKRYLNNRKVAEAVSRFLSNSVDPLFYLSSFQYPFAGNPVASQRRGFSMYRVMMCGYDPSVNFADSSPCAGEP